MALKVRESGHRKFQAVSDTITAIPSARMMRYARRPLRLMRDGFIFRVEDILVKNPAALEKKLPQ